MFSIVCVYNDEEILKDWLLKSVSNQTSKYELILVDNTHNKFKSAAEALNFGGKLAKNDFIMFIHQDFNLLSNNWLEMAESLLRSLPNLGIAGVAGRKNNPSLLTNIKHGIPSMSAGFHQIKESIKVQTLDECLIIIPRDIFLNIIQFDEVTCNDWHLYAVDYCLSIQGMGYDVYVLPLEGYHRSSGFSFNADYFSTLRKVLKKHQLYYVMIFTTCGDWHTLHPLILQRTIRFLLQRTIICKIIQFLIKK